jgi:hypothetical protein
VKYFSEARGLRNGYGLPELRVMAGDLYKYLRDRDYLTEWLGYECVDAGQVEGTGGRNPGSDVVLDIGRTDVWPVEPIEAAWSEDAIFDFLQFIGIKVSTPVTEGAQYHQYANCGWHFEKFKPEPARSEYVERVNKLLSRYGDGWEMKADFEIVERAPVGLDKLVKGELPKSVDSKIRARVQAAVDKYRRRASTASDRRDAVRDLGDVLEALREEAKQHLRDDEKDLFNILNNFGIRHNNAKQKTDYDAIWLAGVFYYCLTLIYVLSHILDRKKKPSRQR